MREDVVMSFIFTDAADQDRLEKGYDPRSIVREIISQDHGSEDVSPFAAWPWADFGKVMGDELIAQNVARYPAKGAELGQSQS